MNNPSKSLDRTSKTFGNVSVVLGLASLAYTFFLNKGLEESGASHLFNYSLILVAAAPVNWITIFLGVFFGVLGLKSPNRIVPIMGIMLAALSLMLQFLSG